jgi:uncharacterized RDD family membrane protein YckC
MRGGSPQSRLRFPVFQNLRVHRLASGCQAVGAVGAYATHDGYDGRPARHTSCYDVGVPSLEPSAAQNGPVIHICSKCGALLTKGTETCPFCEIPSEENEAKQLLAAGAIRMDEAGEPEWRQEVGRRLDQYRAKRRRVRGEEDEPQSGLPFRQPTVTVAETTVSPAPTVAPNKQIEMPIRTRPAQRARGTERMDIWIQPELEFSSAPGDRARPQTATVPVATLGERREAGLIDAIFVVLTCAAFAGLFRSLGGQIVVDKIDAIVCAAVLFLFYGLYLLIFTVFGGPTPGMLIRGLSVVRLDGGLPETRQLIWRGFGYVLSGAALMLGFVWALWDEDRFTWHDRISQTYITAATPAQDAGPIEIRPRRRTLAHR